MITKQKIKKLCSNFFAKNKDLFLVDIKISSGNDIFIKIDGDKGVAIDRCIELSREIEENLDRDEEDFSLEVSSYDIMLPLIMERQYKKNEGRTLLILTNEGIEYKGILKEYDMEGKKFRLLLKSNKEQKELLLKDLSKIKIVLKF